MDGCIDDRAPSVAPLGNFGLYLVDQNPTTAVNGRGALNTTSQSPLLSEYRQ